VNNQFLVHALYFPDTKRKKKIQIIQMQSSQPITDLMPRGTDMVNAEVVEQQRSCFGTEK
jgi:hypothetical protein